MKKLFTFSCLFLFISFTSFAQLKIGTPAGAPAASAILDISNTGAATNAKKGFLGPQVALSGTDDATTVPTPVAGLMVYNTNTSAAGATAVVAGYYYYNGTQWVQMVSSAAPANGNIYTADGTLTGNRTVNMGTNTLNFTGSNIGIGSSAPNAPLQFNSVTATRKIVLFEGVNNDNQFYGLGINTDVLRYQVDATTANHAFFAGTSATTSNELMRIQGNGNVGIGTATPSSTLHVAGSFQTAFLATGTNTTLTAAHHILQATNTGLSSVTIFTLPTNSASLAGREYVFIAPIQASNGSIGQAITAKATIASGTANIIINGEAVGLTSFDVMGSSTCTVISDGTNWIVTGASPNQMQVEKSDLTTDQLIVNFNSSKQRGGILKVEGGQHSASGGGLGNFYISLLLDVVEGTFAKAEMFGHGLSRTPTFSGGNTIVSFTDNAGPTPITYTYTISGSNLNFKSTAGGARPLRVTITKL